MIASKEIIDAEATIDTTKSAEIAVTSVPSSPANSVPTYASLLTLQELVSRLASHVHAAHDEIGETRAILRDAIERLMPAFTQPGNTVKTPLNIPSADAQTANADTAERINQIRDAGRYLTAFYRGSSMPDSALFYMDITKVANDSLFS